VLSERDFPYSNIKMLASARSAGRTYDFEGETYTVEELKENSFGDCDIALFSAGGGISKKFGPIASDAGCTVVDNSSAFRMTEGVPLVIPEVNADAMAGMKVRAPLRHVAAYPVWQSAARQCMPPPVVWVLFSQELSALFHT
jgi:aspartate-semialdehyde dehydrogenase